jgi:DNA-binding MarR family transcriptional regulator
MNNSDRPNDDIDPGALLAMFRQTHDAILKIRQKELRKHGLTPEQLGALQAIRAIGNKATAAQLSKWLFRNPDTTTIMLRRLEKRGLIKKTPDINRKNIIRLSLTRTGEEILHNASQANTAYNLFNKLSVKKKKQLWVLLEKLRSQALAKLNMDENTYSGFFNEFQKEDLT